jgi:4-amino-4-deoxy-L-arabinose transferase-like glycosyltransferase
MIPALKRLLSSPVFITVFAFLLRILWLYHHSKGLPTPVLANSPYGYEVGRVARAIAAGEGFSSPLDPLKSGPTAWFTPIYPYLLAGIFKIWGIYSDTSRYVIQMLECAFVSLTVIPIYGIAKRTFGAATAVGAVWVWALLPNGFHFPVEWIWDTTMAALFLSLIFWATLSMQEDRGSWSWIGYGALCAFGVLINPSIFAVVPFLLGWLIWGNRKRSAHWMRSGSLAILVFTICLVPWTVRNYLVLGKAIPLRSNFGLELWLGNNPEVLDTWSLEIHPMYDAAEGAKFVRMGEIAYMAEKQHLAFEYMRTHPGRTVNLIFRRFAVLWLATSDSPIDLWSTGNWYSRSVLFLNCGVSLLCFLGTMFAFRQRKPDAAPYAFVILMFPLVFYLTHSSLRYRFPMDPIMIVLAASAFAQIFSFVQYHCLRLSPTITEAPSVSTD